MSSSSSVETVRSSSTFSKVKPSDIIVSDHKKSATNLSFEVLIPLTDLLEDHGFHILHQTLKQDQFERTFSNIMKIRALADLSETCRMAEFCRCSKKCEDCSTYKRKLVAEDTGCEPNPLLRGILYAPEGSGMTYAMNKGSIMGVHTRWLVRNAGYETLMKPFLEDGLLMLTDDYRVLEKSNEAMFGYLNTNHLKQKPDRSGPLLDLGELYAFRDRNADKFILIDGSDDMYLDDFASYFNFLLFTNSKLIAKVDGE